MRISNFCVVTVTGTFFSPGILSLFSVSGLHIEFNTFLIKSSFSHCLDFILSLVQPDCENDLQLFDEVHVKF